MISHPHAFMQNRSSYFVNKWVASEGLSSRETVFHETIPYTLGLHGLSSHTQVPLPSRGSRNSLLSGRTHPGEAGGSWFLGEGKQFSFGATFLQKCISEWIKVSSLSKKSVNIFHYIDTLSKKDYMNLSRDEEKRKKTIKSCRLQRRHCAMFVHSTINLQKNY